MMVVGNHPDHNGEFDSHSALAVSRSSTDEGSIPESWAEPTLEEPDSSPTLSEHQFDQLEALKDAHYKGGM